MKNLLVMICPLLFLLGSDPAPVEAATFDHVQAIYQACLGRGVAHPDAAAYWAAHPDPETGICTSVEARGRLEPRGLVWFSSSTWMPAVMVEVRDCESGGVYGAENPRSTASGGWQFLDGTWRWVTGLAPPASAYPVAVQDRAAAMLLRIAGGDPWSSVAWGASAGCWS
jgi:hypothetical protein